MELLTVIIVWILVLIIVIAILCFFASTISDIAEDKGYEKKKWFILCLVFAPIAYLFVVAMPDLVARQKQDQMNYYLERMLSYYEGRPIAGNQTNAANALRNNRGQHF